MEDAWQTFWFTVILLVVSLFGLHLTLRGFVYRRPDWSRFRWKFWQPRPGEDKKKFYTSLLIQLLAVAFLSVAAFYYIRYLNRISAL